MGKAQFMDTLFCRPGASVPATVHWWGLYKFAHAGVISGYEDEEQGWSMYGQELARVDGRFYDDFAPATFHLSAGRRQNQYLKDRPEMAAAERDSLLQAVRNMESYAVLDEYLDSVRLSKEDVLRGQEYVHVQMLREKYGPEAVLLMNEGNPICEILDPAGCVGFENGLIQLLEEPEKMAYLIDGAYKAILPRMEALKEVGADGYIGSETYCTRDVMSPRLWRELIFPAQQHFYQSIDKMGLIPIVYFLGDVLPIIDDLKQLGARGLMVEESKKTYDLDIGRIYDSLERQMCLFGNIDSVYTLQMGTPEDVRREAKRQLQTCNKGGFILSNGCPISFDTPKENIHALLNAVNEDY